MNVENINERLLRTERERDEAREEVSQLHMRAASWPGYNIEAAKAEIASLRAEVDRMREVEAGELREARDEAIRLYKEREEARAEVKLLRNLNSRAERALQRAGFTDCGGVEWKPPIGPDPSSLLAELARLRAAANERAIAELNALFLWVWDVRRPDCFPKQEHAEAWNQLVCETRQWCRNRIEALRAETPAAPQPAPSGGVERAIAELEAQASKIEQAAKNWQRSSDVCGDRDPHERDRLASRADAQRGVAFWIRERAKEIRAEQQAAPVPPAAEVFREAAKNCTGEMFGEAAAVKPPVTPPADAPNDPTKNVCAIRRRSDGYWWECNGEHGAGWNDKRIRQAWTHRAAHVEVERMKASGVRDDVEVVELAPKPCGEDDPKTVAALALEAVKRDITLAVREKYSNPNLPTIYCDNNGNGWRINYDEMHTLLSGRIKQARSGTWFWPKPVEPADAPSRPSVLRKLFFVQDAERPMHVVATSWQHAVERWRDLMRVENEGNDDHEPEGVSLVATEAESFPELLLDDALAGRGGAK